MMSHIHLEVISDNSPIAGLGISRIQYLQVKILDKITISMTRSRTCLALMDKEIPSPRNAGLKFLAKMTTQRVLEAALFTLESLPVIIMDSRAITPTSILHKKQMPL